MLSAWYAWSGGMSGHGPLPWAGGYLEQPALLMDAFATLSAGQAALRRARDAQKGADDGR